MFNFWPLWKYGYQPSINWEQVHVGDLDVMFNRPNKAHTKLWSLLPCWKGGARDEPPFGVRFFPACLPSLLWVSVLPGLSAHLSSKMELSKVSFRWDRKYWSSPYFWRRVPFAISCYRYPCWPTVFKHLIFIWLSERLTKVTSTLYCFF